MSQFPVAPITAPEQRGQSWLDELRKTSVSRSIVTLTAPLGLAGHCAAPTFGIQRSVRRSGSFRGLPLDVATSFRRSGREGRGPRRPLRSASGTNVAGPHAAAEAGSGGG